MKGSYWLQRWREDRTGWHHSEPIPLLIRHWPALGVPAGSRVLVPLAGKSLDMLWLAEQGFAVLGVELSELAVPQFFSENHLAVQSQLQVDGMHYTAGDLADPGRHLQGGGACVRVVQSGTT